MIIAAHRLKNTRIGESLVKWTIIIYKSGLEVISFPVKINISSLYTPDRRTTPKCSWWWPRVIDSFRRAKFCTDNFAGSDRRAAPEVTCSSASRWRSERKLPDWAACGHRPTRYASSARPERTGEWLRFPWPERPRPKGCEWSDHSVTRFRLKLWGRRIKIIQLNLI